MLTDSLTKLYQRDIDKVIAEINAYKSEADIWKISDGINNSAGNLALHLIGNLKTYIGKNLGKKIMSETDPLSLTLKIFQE